MSGETFVLLFWTTALTILTTVVVREASLLKARIDYAGRAVGDGPEVGSLAPASLRTDVRRQVALFLSATCAPCHELVADLAAGGLAAELLPVISGDESSARELADRLPGRPSPIVGAEADVVTSRSGVRLQPFALLIESGIVVGKSYPTGAASLQALVGAR